MPNVKVQSSNQYQISKLTIQQESKKTELKAQLLTFELHLTFEL
jgi:hypothetical protein